MQSYGLTHVGRGGWGVVWVDPEAQFEAQFEPAFNPTSFMADMAC